MPPNRRFASSSLWSRRPGAGLFRQRTGEPLGCIGSEVLLELRLAAALLVLEELEGERFPARARDDLEVERRDRVVRRLGRALRRIDVGRIAVVVHAEVANVALAA